MRDITGRLDAIRPEVKPYQAWNMRALAAALLGAAMGFLAKALDNVAVIGEIGTNLGVWIFTAALLAAYSSARRAAALRVLLFFAGMLVAYYLHSMLVEGFFPARYALTWGVFALLSPACAMIAWLGRGRGWLAAISAALPAALLLTEGYPALYTGSLPLWFDLLAAVLLLLYLPPTWKQRFLCAAFAMVFAVVFSKLGLISLLWGGL